MRGDESVCALLRILGRRLVVGNVVSVDGLGVALESTWLAEREMKSRKLVAPLAGRAKDVRYVGHFLVYPRAAHRRQTLRVFPEWMADELELGPIVEESATLVRIETRIHRDDFTEVQQPAHWNATRSPFSSPRPIKAPTRRKAQGCFSR
jgi:hypothetical protein